MTPATQSSAGAAGLEGLLEAVFQRYHYDFRHYARPHLARRVERAVAALGCASVPELQERVLAEPTAMGELVHQLTVQVSDLFRDPGYFRVLREEVVPHLATYPSIRVWVAGCATGEEAHSLAILLHEEGLLERTLIYATDIDAGSLRQGGAGTYAVERVRRFSENYFAAGGKASLSDYYTAAYGRVAFRPWLRERVLFTDHSLATDAPFAEVHLVSCRNVLIYFARRLQERALSLFRDSLCPRGFLGLGPRESLRFSSQAAAFEPVSEEQRVFRLR